MIKLKVRDRKCRNCGNLYFTCYNGQKYCGWRDWEGTCAYLFFRKNNAHKFRKLLEKKCITCGIHFTTYTDSKQVCGLARDKNSCMHKMTRNIVRERYFKRKELIRQKISNNTILPQKECQYKLNGCTGTHSVYVPSCNPCNLRRIKISKNFRFRTMTYRVNTMSELLKIYRQLDIYTQ